MGRLLQWFFGIIAAVAGALADYRVTHDLDHPVDFGVVCVIAVMAFITLLVASKYKEK